MRLLGPLEAVNGLLLLGLSTALMFAVMSHLILNRLRSRYGDWEEQAGGHKTTPAAGGTRSQ